MRDEERIGRQQSAEDFQKTPELFDPWERQFRSQNGQNDFLKALETKPGTDDQMR